MSSARGAVVVVMGEIVDRPALGVVDEAAAKAATTRRRVSEVSMTCS
ncbi:hypothetical protein [Streptomyces sp. NPDC001970]